MILFVVESKYIYTFSIQIIALRTIIPKKFTILKWSRAVIIINDLGSIPGTRMLLLLYRFQVLLVVRSMRVCVPASIARGDFNYKVSVCVCVCILYAL